MPDERSGFTTAVTGAISGFVAELLLRSFVNAGLVNSMVMVAYQVGNIFSIITFVHATKYWGACYLLGWWFGFGIMSYTGVAGPVEFTIDSIILVSVLISRLVR